MQNSTTKKQEELLHLSTNVEDTPKENYPLIEKRQIENTPFWEITDNTSEYSKRLLVMGKYKLAELENGETAEDYIKLKTWEIIMHMIIIIREQSKELENLQTNKTKNND